MNIESTIIARRKTYDDYTVLAFDDGYVTGKNGSIISRGLDRMAMGLFLGDISLYDYAEARTLASCAKRAVRENPDSSILARQRMRSLMGPPPEVRRNPIGVKDYVLLGTALISAGAVLYELFKPASKNVITKPLTPPNETVFSYDGQVINAGIGHIIIANLIFTPPQVGWRVDDTTGNSLMKSSGTASGNSQTIEYWTVLTGPGQEVVTYVAVDANGNALTGPGNTMSMTVNVIPGTV